MKIPKFLRNLLQSNNYCDKNSAKFAKANEYLGKLFPGQLQQDVTGQYIEPEYDKFLDAQKKFDDDIQNEKLIVSTSNIPNDKEQKSENKTDPNKVTDIKMSIDGINWLKGKEDKILDKQGNHIIYDDQTGKPVNTKKHLPKGATIGYGHLIKKGEDFRNRISEAKATELLRADIAIAERAVQDNINVPLTQNQFDALTSLAYNIGTKNFAISTVVKYINNPKFHSSVYPNLESAWKAWNRSQGEISNGLINRRQNEWNMYSRCIY